MAESDQRPLERISFEANKAIALQGDVATSFGILRKGRVDVLVSAQTDEPVSLHQVMNEGVLVESLEEEGQLVGEAGALLGRNHATLIARSATTLELIPLSHGSIDKSILSLPSLGLTMSQSLAARLLKKNEQLKQRGSVLTEMRRAVDEYSLKFYRLCERLMRRYGVLRPVAESCRVALASRTFRRGRRLQRQQEQDFSSLASLAAGRRGRLLSIQAGTHLCEEGAESGELYIVTRGLFEVLVEGRVIELVRPGEVVGEMALLLGGGTKRTATVRAHTFSQVAVIPAGKFEVLVERHPTLILHIAKVLARRIANADNVIGQYQRLVSDALEQLYSEENSCGEDSRRLLEGLKGVRDKLENECEELSSVCKKIMEDYETFSDMVAESAGPVELEADPSASPRQKLEYEWAIGTAEEIFDLLSARPSEPQPQCMVMLMSLARRLVLRKQPTYAYAMLSPHGGSLPCHSLNTAIVALKIATDIGLRTRERELVVAGALLHDVGMLAADAVSEEKELPLHVSTHAEEKLALLPDLPDAVQAVIRQHHECWDGSGYPNGLKEEEIAIAARLVAVANDLDIMLMKGTELGKATKALERERKRYWPEAHRCLLDIVRRVLGAKNKARQG